MGKVASYQIMPLTGPRQSSGAGNSGRPRRYLAIRASAPCAITCTLASSRQPSVYSKLAIVAIARSNFELYRSTFGLQMHLIHVGMASPVTRSSMARPKIHICPRESRCRLCPRRRLHTNVRESLIDHLRFPRPVRNQRSVAASVTQQRLNSVQPSASTVSVWRQLSRGSSITLGLPAGVRTHREIGGCPAQSPPPRVLCINPAPTPYR